MRVIQSALCSLLLTTLAPAAAPGDPAPPNIVLIVSDDLAWTD